ncbi:MAG TPA: hypothetical protein PKM48_14070, partial [Parvularculaceae bacterium]|nr:hypothetical protein [Parvularculaceae bacterium]
MSPKIFRNLSIANSLLLIPLSLLADHYSFYVAVILNFAFFHGIWISKWLENRRSGLTDKSPFREMILPLVAFGICGNFGAFSAGL